MIKICWLNKDQMLEAKVGLDLINNYNTKKGEKILSMVKQHLSDQGFIFPDKIETRIHKGTKHLKEFGITYLDIKD